MHGELELRRDADGHIEGSFVVAGQSPVAFSGILEMLRVLEDLEDARDLPCDQV